MKTFAFALLLCAGTTFAGTIDTVVPTLQAGPSMPLGQSWSSPTDGGPGSGYSNLATFTGSGFQVGGTTAQGTNIVTAYVADDINPVGVSPGEFVLTFSFNVANFNSVPVSARPRVRFHLADGPGGTPGTIIGGFTFNAITFGAGSVATFTAGPGLGTALPMPTGAFYAGIMFDNNSGATGATAAQLALLGMGLFNPPTIGTSTDNLYGGPAPVSGSYLASNPALAAFNFNGNPVANAGWAFTVPAPGSVALLGVGAIFAARRRRA